MLDNAVIDIKNHTIKHDLSDYTEYQFIHKTSVPLVFRDLLNETLKFYDTVFKRVMDDWSSNDIENPEFYDNKNELTDCELIMFKMLILRGNHFAQLMSDLYL